MPTVAENVAFSPANLGLRGGTGSINASTRHRTPWACSPFRPASASRGLTTLMVTHDLPYALQLCPRSVVLSGGRVVADGPTAELLADDALHAQHRLELPYGFTVPVPRS